MSTNNHLKESAIKHCINLTRELVMIPSESSSATNTVGPPEEQICHYLQNLSAKHGLSYELQEVLPDRNNIVLKLPKPGRPKMLITAHMDTVSGTGMSDPFGAKIKDGNIYGRGACDNKGSLAVLFATFINFQKLPLCYDLTIAATVDEECSMAGAAMLSHKNPAGWDLCLAMEPSLLKPISCHIGVYRCRIILPQDKNRKNNQHQKKCLQDIETDLQALVKKVTSATHHKLGKAKFSVTLIERDETTSLPRILVDIRLLPEHNPAQIHDTIMKIVKERALVIPLFTGLGIEADPRNNIIQSLQKTIASQGVNSELIAVPYPSDCSQLKRNRSECMVWGPGDPQNAHQNNEFVAIKQLEQACEILHNFLTAAE